MIFTMSQTNELILVKFIRAGLKRISEGEHESNSKAHIQHLEQQVQSLRTEKGEMASMITGLRNNLDVEIENGKKIKESANRMAYALESKDLYVGRQDSDDNVYSRFQVLIGQIKTWSVPFAKDPPLSHLKFAPELIEEFHKVAPGVTDFPRFLKTPKNIRLLARGYVSVAMTEMLFRTLPTATHPGSDVEDVWMDRNLSHAVFLIENRLLHAGKPILCCVGHVLIETIQDRKVISPRELHDWRALSTTLISKVESASSKTGKGMEGHVIGCSNRIMGVVGNCVATESKKALEDSLLPVLLYAVHFSQTLRCQRALWSVRHLGGSLHRRLQSGPWDGKVEFDEGTMDDKHGDDDSDGEGAHIQHGKVVEVLITPALFKSGNTDGERFDVETCVERSEVKCHTLPVRSDHPVVGREKRSSQGLAY